MVTLVAVLLHCVWGRGREGAMVLALLSAGSLFSHSLSYPQSNWALLVLLPKWVGLCMFWNPVGLSNELSCEARNFSCCRLNPHRCFQSVVWGFLSLHWKSGLHGLSPGPPAAPSSASYNFAHPTPQSATLLGLPAATLPRVLSTRLPISSPPTGQDECFFFNSLVVGLPYSSIFCQFWLFLVYKLLFSFFWLWGEAQCVYLHLHLGWKSSFSNMNF